MPPKTRSKLDTALQPWLWIGVALGVASLGWFAYLLLFTPNLDAAVRNNWLLGCGVDLLGLTVLAFLLRQGRRR